MVMDRQVLHGRAVRQTPSSDLRLAWVDPSEKPCVVMGSMGPCFGNHVPAFGPAKRIRSTVNSTHSLRHTSLLELDSNRVLSPLIRTKEAEVRVELLALSLGLIVVGTLHSGAAFQQASVPRQLGKVEVLAGPERCSGGECYEIRVTCSEVAAPARARLKVAAAGTSPKGTILFTTGGLGTALYDSTPETSRILGDLSTAGFRTVQLQWIDSWALGSAGKEEGHVRLGCRPATVARWVHDHLHQPGPTSAFCATGHSGGAAQVAYMLSRWARFTMTCCWSGNRPSFARQSFRTSATRDPRGFLAAGTALTGFETSCSMNAVHGRRNLHRVVACSS